MGRSQSQDACISPAGQGLLSEEVAQVMMQLRDRRRRFAEYDDVGALRITAVMLVQITNTFARRIKQVCGANTPREELKRLAGERGKPLEDFVLQCLSEPEAMLEPVSTLLEAMGLERPGWAATAPQLKGVPEELADVIDAVSRASAQGVRDLSDASFDDPETLLELVTVAGTQLAELRAAITKDIEGRNRDQR